jgi:two-component system, OmpR family, sensor histidine kinase KdpD
VPESNEGRPDPEHLLRQAAAEERRRTHGRLKVYLGYAAGVGKSFRMLDEGRRRHERGQDVVVGAVQRVQPPEVQRILAQLEVIAFLPGGEAMDVEAILRRQPQVCLVDGLAYDNPPGSRHPWRWQDVDDLLQAGITVIGSLNLQHIQERAAEVERITGKRAKQTVPESFVAAADGIVLVDMTPELLLKRTADTAGPVPDNAAASRQLSRLREIALLLAAGVVDRQLHDYLDEQGLDAVRGTVERVLVCITPRANAAMMIGAAKRTVDRFHGELLVLYVRQAGLGEADRAALERHLQLATQAGASIEVMDSLDPVRSILDVARRRGVTQIFIGHSARGGWRDRLFGGPVDRLIALADGIDVSVFPH